MIITASSSHVCRIIRSLCCQSIHLFLQAPFSKGHFRHLILLWITYISQDASGTDDIVWWIQVQVTVAGLYTDKNVAVVVSTTLYTAVETQVHRHTDCTHLTFCVRWTAGRWDMWCVGWEGSNAQTLHTSTIFCQLNMQHPGPCRYTCTSDSPARSRLSLNTYSQWPTVYCRHQQHRVHVMASGEGGGTATVVLSINDVRSRGVMFLYICDL